MRLFRFREVMAARFRHWWYRIMAAVRSDAERPDLRVSQDWQRVLSARDPDGRRDAQRSMPGDQTAGGTR